MHACTHTHTHTHTHQAEVMNKLLTNSEAPAKEKHVRSECNQVCLYSLPLIAICLPWLAQIGMFSLWQIRPVTKHQSSVDCIMSDALDHIHIICHLPEYILIVADSTCVVADNLLPAIHVAINRHPDSHVEREGLPFLLEGAAPLPPPAQPCCVLEGLFHPAQNLS